MNIIDIIMLAILAFSVLAGIYKGFISSALATAGLVGSWLGAQALYERVANFALSNDSLMSLLRQYLEPETFFKSASQAATSVADVVAGGENAISGAVSTVQEKLPFLADLFKQNVQGQSFSGLGLNTLADYLDRTVWTAAFKVLAFVLTFLVLYWAATLLVNLLNRVFRFPVLRGFDWLLGGVFGLARGLVIVVLLLSILPMVLSAVVPSMAESLQEGSKLWAFVEQLDLLSIRTWVASLLTA